MRVTVTGVLGEPLTLRIADDGSGSRVLSPDDAQDTSTGLRGMRDRVARRGGTVAIESADGTTVVVSIPSVGLTQ